MRAAWNRFVLTGVAFGVLLTSCATAYGSFEIAGGNQDPAYVLGNPASERLIIYLDGSGKHSTLGTRQDGRWRSVGAAYLMQSYFGKDYALLVPERLGLAAGQDISGDPERMSAYTAENLIQSYAAAIDGYLDGHEYRSVCLIGFSEGGLVLPGVYGRLRHQSAIGQAVVWGSGGMSQLDCFRTLAGAGGALAMPGDYRTELGRVDAIAADLQASGPGADAGKSWLGWPYSRWRSFFAYRPLDGYRAMSIPVLFIQGRQDWSTPWQSVALVERELPEKPFSYRYQETMGHSPSSNAEWNQRLAEMKEWMAAHQ
jgi:pimeloyl-ACP methyl ester carboxylesterase